MACRQDMGAAHQRSTDLAPAQSLGVQLRCRVAAQSHSQLSHVAGDLSEPAVLVLDSPVANYMM